jgi:hypothetical protein|tara:strand:- start:647 stop:1105 length:459 start_codon:yes stop_codon:yes gene_type:complete
MFLKWWFVFVVQTIGLIVFAYMDGIQYMLDNDKTYLSIVIAFIWLIVSTSVGYYTWKKIEKPEFLWFAGESCMTVGMIGTIIGFILMLGSSLNNLDPGDVESMRIAISSMAVGMSTALLTTLAGLTATLMLRVQLVMTDAPTETGAISDNDK